MKHLIYIIDDLAINRDILSGVLSEKYEIAEFAEGSAALSSLFSAEVTPVAILLDLMLPGMNGFEVLDAIKQNEAFRSIPVIFITAAEDSDFQDKSYAKGAADYIRKPFNPYVVHARVDNLVDLYLYRKSLNEKAVHADDPFLKAQERMLHILASIIEYRSLESGMHIRRMCELTRALISAMLTKDMFKDELSSLEPELIIKAAALHDIGKIGVPEAVLLKPGRLTPAEFDIIKSHSAIGGEIVSSIKIEGSETYLKHGHDICRHHHERWDGTGYPDHLMGEEIPLSARILAIVDVYDALVSRRCYKPEFSFDETYRLLKSGSGTQFQPEIVDCLFEAHSVFEKIQLEFEDIPVNHKP
ncbi:two-component system response regulator [Clostridia bacterium]|nr:two-component system response regulator [Clostridia bacterium]